MLDGVCIVGSGTVTRTKSMLLLMCRETNETMWPVNYSCQTSKENEAGSLFLFPSFFDVVVVMVWTCLSGTGMRERNGDRDRGPFGSGNSTRLKKYL